jgi:hypothetical protein
MIILLLGFVIKGKRPFDEEIREMNFNWAWNDKRYIPGNNAAYLNPFKHWTIAQPWATIEDAIQYRREKEDRRRKLTKEVRELARKLSKKGLPKDEIARRLEISRMQLHRLEQFYE